MSKNCSRERKGSDVPDKWLMLRFGGIGDTMCVTTAARGVKQIYPNDEIHIGVRTKEQVAILKNQKDLFKKVIELDRLPHPIQGMNVHKVKDGWESIEQLKAKGGYTVVMDFVNCIENNTVHPELVPKYGEWCASMNSNFVNWTDIHLGWCRIDPTKVDPENKRPSYKVEQDERKWAKLVLKKFPKPWIGMNFFASSRARTLFDISAQINYATEQITGATFFIWDQTQWQVVRKGGQQPLGVKTDLRKSAALVEQFDVFVGADSGLSHIAEAVNTRNVAIYTTVPAWTRNQYYKYSHDIDVQLSCSPCFTLHSHCPINRRRAQESLSERERSVVQLSQSGQPIQIAASHLNTTPDKLSQEFQAIQAKMDSLASVIPDCIASVTPDLVTEKILEALDVERNGSSSVQEGLGAGEVDRE